MADTIKHYKDRIKQDDSAAEAYTGRRESKNTAEMNLVRKGFASCENVSTGLDAPCGVGRASILMASLGIETTGIDLGDAAVRVAQREVENSDQSATIETGNLENLKYADKSFDAVLCFRFYHHLPSDDLRQKVINELCRTTKDYVLISYFSPYSFTSIKRAIKEKLNIKRSIQHACTLASISEKFTNNGFKLVQDIPQQRFVHTLHLAVFKRAS